MPLKAMLEVECEQGSKYFEATTVAPSHAEYPTLTQREGK